MNLRTLFVRRRAVAPAPEAVEGERTIPSVNRERSMQSRTANVLVLGAIGVIGAASMGWYYATQLGRIDAADKATKQALAKRAGSDQKLPPLGRIPPPERPPAGVTPVSMKTTTGGLLGAPPPPPPPASSAAYGAAATALPPSTATTNAGPPQKTPAQVEEELKLSATVMQRGKTSRGIAAVGASIAPGAGSALGGMLKAAATPAVSARLLADRRYTSTKGTMIDCTLRTAIDSTLPGMVLCVGATDVYGVDGSVVLLEQGTQYVGETKGDVRQGQSRVAVVWTEATTPTGVRINLDSPGTDSLGRSGLEGWTDTHFWDRFGAAIMLSLVNSSVGALAASQQHSGSGATAVALNPTSGGDIAGEVLKSTVAIPPTVRVAQGERIQILVARDVDFRSVYELRASHE